MHESLYMYKPSIFSLVLVKTAVGMQCPVIKQHKQPQDILNTVQNSHPKPKVRGFAWRAE